MLADRAHPQIDKLDVLLTAIIKAKGAIVDVVKFFPHEIQRRMDRQAMRNLDMDLVTFAKIADVGDEMHRDRVLGNSLGLDIGKSKPPEVSPGGDDFFGIGRSFAGERGS